MVEPERVGSESLAQCSGKVKSSNVTISTMRALYKKTLLVMVFYGQHNSRISLEMYFLLQGLSSGISSLCI